MNYIVQVNEVKGKESNIRAYANIVLDEVFKITNIAIIENSEKGQLFVSMPRYRTKLVDENDCSVYRDVCHPITKEFREKLYGTIFEVQQLERKKRIQETNEKSVNQPDKKQESQSKKVKENSK